MSSPSNDGARVVAITGAATGIGWTAAQRFAASGDYVVILDRDSPAALGRAAELGPRHLGLHVNVAIEKEVVAAISLIGSRFGRLDVLVNNAGVIDAAATPAEQGDLAHFRELMAINLDGAFVAAREAARLMLSRGGGAIVNVASLAGMVAIPNRNAYSLSKAAMIGMTRALACEWAGAGVRVNAVLPGYVGTDMVRALVEGRKVDLGRVERRIPLGRLAEPDEIAALIYHLASPEAGYTAGAAIAVDGGYQAFGGTGDASAGGRSRAVPAAGPRVVLVTGAASGIGAAIARQLAAKGNRLVLFDRNARQLEAIGAELGRSHATVIGDVTSESDAAAAVAAGTDRFGRIDLLVNNAGVADAFEPTIKQSLESFRRGMDVNLTGALVLAKAVAPAMIAQRFGAIVNISSIAGLLGLPRRNAYCAAKAGIVMLTRSLACEWAVHGIRVNAVAPGYIATPGVTALEREGKRDLDAVRRRTPMGRLGAPDEIASVVDFLASDEASYITGTIYPADGGWSAYGDAGPAFEE